MNGKDKNIGTGKRWSIKGIYCFNELFQMVRNDRLTNYQFVAKWLKQKRDDYSFGEKKKQYMYPQKVMHDRHYVTERVIVLMMSFTSRKWRILKTF